MHVILFLNHQCNLACSYCYNGAQFDSPLSKERIKQGIDLAFTQGDVRITFFGGEPLLEFDAIKYAVAYARQQAALQQKHLKRFCLTTNATVVTDEMLNFFKTENFFVAVSLDGTPTAHNLNRVFSDGKDTAHVVENNLKKIKEQLGYAVISSTIDSSNVQWLADSFAHVISLGAQRFSFNFNYDANWSEDAIDIFKEQMKEVTQHYVAAYRNSNPINFSTFTSKIQSHLNNGIKAKCKFGEGEITLAPSGRLYPCERLVGQDNTENLCIGDIDNGINLQKVLDFKRSRLHKDVDCQSCQVEHRCIHFCGCVNYATTGTIGDVSSLLCEVEQTNIQCADTAASILFEEQNPGFLKRFYQQ